MEFKLGNNKIGKDTLIFNMGSATHCPSKLKGLCNIDCYALKAEKQYKAVLPYRERQGLSWLSSDAFKIAEEITKFTSNRKNVKYIRVNESGDLHSTECLDKLIDIANMFPNFKFYTYSHRSDLIDDDTHKKLPSNLVINTSNFKVTGLNQFKAVRTSFKVKSHKNQALEIRKELKEKYETNIICMGDCSVCNLCKITHTKDILTPVH